MNSVKIYWICSIVLTNLWISNNERAIHSLSKCNANSIWDLHLIAFYTWTITKIFNNEIHWRRATNFEWISCIPKWEKMDDDEEVEMKKKKKRKSQTTNLNEYLINVLHSLTKIEKMNKVKIMTFLMRFSADITI